MGETRRIGDLGVCHIVGNGPGKAMWKPQDHPGEQSIGCNLEKNVQLVVLYDRKILTDVSQGGLKIRRPVLLGPNATDEVMRSNHPAFQRLLVVGIVAKHPLNVLNAGQAAIVWALRVGYTDLRLYGFDSLWTRQRETDSDEYWKKGEEQKKGLHHKAMHRWDRGWRKFFEVYPDVKPTVIAPPGSKLKGPYRGYFRLQIAEEAEG